MRPILLKIIIVLCCSIFTAFSAFAKDSSIVDDNALATGQIPIDEYQSFTESEWQEAIEFLETATPSEVRDWERSIGWFNSLRRFKEEHSNQVPENAINNPVLSALISRNGWVKLDEQVINFSHTAVRTYAAPLTMDSKLLAKMKPIGDKKPGESDIATSPTANDSTYSGFTCASGTPYHGSDYVKCKHSVMFSSGKKGYVSVKVKWVSYSYYSSMTAVTAATYTDGSSAWGSYAIKAAGTFYYQGELEGTVSVSDTCKYTCYSDTEELFSCGGNTLVCNDYTATGITSSGKYGSSSFSGPSISGFDF